MNRQVMCTLGRFLAIAVFAFAKPAAARDGPCPPEGYDRDSLLSLKTAGFDIADTTRRNATALGLIACLSDPDPTLRDGVVFEAYSTWLRGNLLDVQTRTALLQQLSASLTPVGADAAGFRQPFAALVLSEVARTDRIDPWLSPEQRSSLLDTATSYVEAIRDYRGFDPSEGWRHGVAHGADLLTQLALNPALGRADLDRILAAAASQVAPAGDHAYTDGEPERLARPVLFVAQRGLHSRADWEGWFRQLTLPAPLASWSEAYQSRAGLARRHNLTFFLLAAYAGARESGDARLEVVVPGLQKALRAMQ